MVCKVVHKDCRNCISTSRMSERTDHNNTLWISDRSLKSVLAAVRAERFDFVVSSPLLDFIQELPENRPSEVVWQTARYVVFDEGFNDGLQRIKVEFTNQFLPPICDVNLVLPKQHNTHKNAVLNSLQCVCSDRVVVSPDQAVNLVVGCRLGVRGVTVSSQSSTGVPVSSQALLIQVNMNR